MSENAFSTIDGLPVPALSAAQMREVDRIAVEEFGLGILQMMENAGRSLAQSAMDLLERAQGQVVVLAGAGGNGGGGLCCARHLHNRGFEVWLVLSKPREALEGAALAQLETLEATGMRPLGPDQAESAVAEADLAIDALIGYSLRGAPRGRAADLIDLCNRHARTVLSLDVPSGLDATTGEAPGTAIRADRTLTLALPKTGLRAFCGALYLADIGIPPEVYLPLGISLLPPFGERFIIQLRTVQVRN